MWLHVNTNKRVRIEWMAIDYRSLLKKLEKTLEKIEESPSIASMLHTIVESIVVGLGPEFGITGGRLYEQTNSHYQLVSQAALPSSC